MDGSRKGFRVTVFAPMVALFLVMRSIPNIAGWLGVGAAGQAGVAINETLQDHTGILDKVLSAVIKNDD